MGAWGHSSFANDDAADWWGELIESTDLSKVTEALDAVTTDSDGELEAPECCSAVAAAEVVATLNGHPSRDLPDELAEWLADKTTLSTELQSKARSAVDGILQSSELQELWEEADDEYPSWVAAMHDLQTRLSI